MRSGPLAKRYLPILALAMVSLILVIVSQSLIRGASVEGQVASPDLSSTPVTEGSPVLLGTPLSTATVLTALPTYPTATLDLTLRFPPTTTPEPNIHAPGSVPFPRPLDDSNEPVPAPNEFSTDRYDCSDFNSIEGAARYVYPNDPNHLDQDGDGVPCEGVLPHSYELPVTPTSSASLRNPAEQSTRAPQGLPITLPTFGPGTLNLPTPPSRPIGLPTLQGGDDECPPRVLICN